MLRGISTADAMLAAHVQYELDQYAPARLATTVRQETAALYAWLGSVQVRDLVQPEQILVWLRRNLVDRPLPAELVDFLYENAVVALEVIQDENAHLDTIVPEAIYDRVLDNVAGMQSMRQAAIHQIVGSSIYARLISNVLYQGIKSFLVSENGIGRTIPGVSAFMRLGQNALNAAAPQLEKGVDKQLVTFISENIRQLIAESETFLERTLDAALIRKVGAELWDTSRDESLATLTAALETRSLGGWADVASDFWRHLRTTPLFDDILQAIVRGFYLRYGKQSAGDLLALIGISEEVAAEELLALADPLVQQARASGYLEARVRARLEPFYNAYFAETEG